MINFNALDINQHLSKAKEMLSSQASSALSYDKFIRRLLSEEFERVNPVYPKTIKIPRSYNEMLRGDFTPSREIVVDEPIMTDGTPIWFQDSRDGVFLRLGYRDGDSRYPSTVKLGGGDIHALLAGMTGRGKSVTLNCIISSLCLEYAPWEVNLVMNDAKIVEFKSYALGNTPPHISSIAATSDADYLISVLEHYENIMMERNKIFPLANGAKNIIDFRRETGLALPQIIIPTDEFQYMFLKAGRKAKRLAEIFDSFGRLGRSAGVHLILASQEIGGSVSKDTLNQIGVRMALGCNPKVSELIIGNDEAKRFKAPGRMILNTNPDVADKRDNLEYRVPFQSTTEFKTHTKIMKDMGEKFDFNAEYSFYDEEDLVYNENYLKYISAFPKTVNKLYLGEPSYVTTDKYKVVSMDFCGNDIENMLIVGNNSDNTLRLLRMLKHNMVHLRGICRSVVLHNDSRLVEAVGLAEISPTIVQVKNGEADMLKGVYMSVYTRKLMIALDDLVFDQYSFTDGSDEIFYQIVDKGSIFDTEINRSRLASMISLVITPEYDVLCPPTGNQEFLDWLKRKFPIILKSYEDYNSLHVKLTREKLPVTYVWLLSIHKIAGLGRDKASSQLKLLKKSIQDSCEFNIRFILQINTLEDVPELRTSIRYFLIDGVPTSELGRIKCTDYFPGEVKSRLGVLYDSEKQECFKFKKMILDGEIVKD